MLHNYIICIYRYLLFIVHTPYKDLKDLFDTQVLHLSLSGIVPGIHLRVEGDVWISGDAGSTWQRLEAPEALVATGGWCKKRLYVECLCLI